MIYVTCYFLIIGTDIKFNHTNSAIHSSGHSHSLLTSASDYTSVQWRLVLNILVSCSQHVNKCWVTRAIYGIRWTLKIFANFDPWLKRMPCWCIISLRRCRIMAAHKWYAFRLKRKKSFIAHPWCLLPIVGLEEYSAHEWWAATSVQRAPVTWREWGLWYKPTVGLVDRFCQNRPLYSLWI